MTFDRYTTYRPGPLARLLPSGRWKLRIPTVTAGSVELHTGTRAELRCLDIAAVGIKKAMLWHTVELRTRSHVETLSCLGEEAASRLANDLHRFINRYLLELIGSDHEALKEVDAKLEPLIEGKRQYLAQADLAQAIARVSGPVAAALSHPLFDADGITADMEANLPRSLSFLTDPERRHRYNNEFVATELARYASFFDDLDGRSLSDQQRESCIRLEDSNLLIASAGAGKSATMVGKVAYVLDKGLYQPEELLVLAYNRTAAEELKERIAHQLGVQPADLQCKVTTFHALGRGIIEQVEARPPQLANWVDHPAGEARVIAKIIEDLMQSDADFAKIWIELLALYPKADIPASVFDSDADYKRYISARRRAGEASIGAFGGIYVKSLQEQTIANWLWLNTVEFEYERQIATQDEDGTIRHVHPDFYYLASNTIHEHLAIDSDGTSPFADYVEHADSKLAAYNSAKLDAFTTTSAQANDGALLLHLEAELSKREIQFHQRSLEEILQAVEPVVIKHFEKLIAICVKHIRAGDLTLEMLLERANSLYDKKRARVFAQAIWKITEAYSNKLKDDKRIDFDAMIANATRLVEEGRYKSPYSLILVDEFQDISDPRASLIKTLKHQKPFAKIFAVGDDWQSIYRFAGSDISIFTQFVTNFGASWQGRLETTYRCNQVIADAAATFIQRNPTQLRKAVRSVRPAIARSIRAIPIIAEQGKLDFRKASLRLLDRLDRFLGGIAGQWRTGGATKLKVMVLWRYNLLDPFGGRLPQFENIEVFGLSFHRAKGLEADYTILLDVSEGDYGVPSRIEDDELLSLVMPRPETFEYAEERRLFYVALTRASRGVFLLMNGQQPSRYIHELANIAGNNFRLETIDGEGLPQCPTCKVGHLVDRKNKAGRRFLGCTQYPECSHTALQTKKRS